MCVCLFLYLCQTRLELIDFARQREGHRIQVPVNMKGEKMLGKKKLLDIAREGHRIQVPLRMCPCVPNPKP
jgi:RNA:NAD 2'-phosphotransferase (TPT1/KptA family)